MAILYVCDIGFGVCRSFTSVSSLREWLDNKRQECGSPEAFEAWLNNYFDEGNEISICGERYDLWGCWELV